MKEIKEIVEEIRDELEGAKHYAEQAAKLKDNDMSRSETYAEMAKQELSHVDKLHGMAVKKIEAHKAAGHEAPAAMQAVWDWEHDRMIKCAAKIRAMLEMARG